MHKKKRNPHRWILHGVPVKKICGVLFFYSCAVYIAVTSYKTAMKKILLLCDMWWNPVVTHRGSSSSKSWRCLWYNCFHLRTWSRPFPDSTGHRQTLHPCPGPQGFEEGWTQVLVIAEIFTVENSRWAESLLVYLCLSKKDVFNCQIECMINKGFRHFTSERFNHVL